MKEVRTILIFIIGGFSIYLTYKTKYQTSFVDAIILLALIVIGTFLFIWTVIKDFQKFSEQRRNENFLLTAICFVFIIIIGTIEYQIQKIFNRPTLIKVYYDGDFNGTEIDFKTNGTYIFNNSAIGFSDYSYGTYKISGDLISLDKKEIDNVIKTDRLKIIEKEVEYFEGIKKHKYLFQVDERGRIIEDETEFKVMIDKR